MKKKTLTYYYKDELNDDFAGFKRNPKRIDKDYKFVSNNLVWNFIAFIVYRIIMTPIAYLYVRLKFRTKIVGKKKFKECKKTGYFMFGNHTNVPFDGYIPTVACGKKTYVVVHPDNIALKGTENYMKMIGAIPTPTTVDGFKPFMNALEKRLNSKCAIAIYPEAHIWPYYTKIRPFKSVSFKYPLKYNKPSYCLTTCYKKRKHSKKPRVVVYVDGPFYPNDYTNQEELRNDIYNVMCMRSLDSDYEYVKYIKKED